MNKAKIKDKFFKECVGNDVITGFPKVQHTPQGTWNWIEKNCFTTENIELVVKLTLAKIDIIKLTSDGYSWSLVGKEEKEKIMKAYDEINKLLNDLNDE